MTILYAVIARGPTVLCSHQVGTGNYDMVMSNILPNIPTSHDAKTSYTSSNKYAIAMSVFVVSFGFLCSCHCKLYFLEILKICAMHLGFNFCDYFLWI